MNTRLIELAERRATLIARAEMQRGDLARAVTPWRKPLAVVDQAVNAIHYLRSHPALVMGAVAFVAALRPRRAVSWFRRGWSLWRMVQNARNRMGL